MFQEKMVLSGNFQRFMWICTPIYINIDIYERAQNVIYQIQFTCVLLRHFSSFFGAVYIPSTLVLINYQR